MVPHFGNREGESVAGNSRIPFVPWLIENVGLGKKTYVYSFKGGTSKGANRWYCLVNSFFCVLVFWCRCTSVYNVLRGAKTGPHPLARKCVLLADNYSENKNNIVAAFCSELVLHGSRCLIVVKTLSSIFTAVGTMKSFSCTVQSVTHTPGLMRRINNTTRYSLSLCCSVSGVIVLCRAWASSRLHRFLIW